MERRDFRFNTYDIRSAKLVPQNQELKLENGKIMIPEVDGYSIIELMYR